MKRKKDIIYDTTTIIKPREYHSYPESADRQTKNGITGITNSIISILQELPPRYIPEYDDDLINIRRNIRGVRENPEEAMKRLEQEENRSNLKAYTKIYERVGALEEEQFDATVDFCLNTFRDGVKRYKQTLRLGKPPMETILDQEENEHPNQQSSSRSGEYLRNILERGAGSNQDRELSTSTTLSDGSRPSSSPDNSPQKTSSGSGGFDKGR